MNCTHNYFVGEPRVVLCQSEQVTGSTSCPDGVITWTPGGTTDTIDLTTKTEYTVDSECFDCPDTDSVTYCFPTIFPDCNHQGIGVDWDDGNAALAIPAGDAFETDYACIGDPIDWTTMEFNYLNAPSGITLAYGGAAGQVQGTLDCTTFPRPGVYYVATRVYSTSGVPSNWALCQISIGEGDYCP